MLSGGLAWAMALTVVPTQQQHLWGHFWQCCRERGSSHARFHSSTQPQTPWVPARVTGTQTHRELHREPQTRPGDNNSKAQTKPPLLAFTVIQTGSQAALNTTCKHSHPSLGGVGGARGSGSGCPLGLEVRLGGAGRLSGQNTWHPGTGRQQRPGGCGAWGWGAWMGERMCVWGARQRGNVSGAPPHARRLG